ncbi:hypothetical protein ACFQVA_03305 [Actinomadura keratinilytica]
MTRTSPTAAAAPCPTSAAPTVHSARRSARAASRSVPATMLGKARSVAARVCPSKAYSWRDHPVSYRSGPPNSSSSEADTRCRPVSSSFGARFLPGHLTATPRPRTHPPPRLPSPTTGRAHPPRLARRLRAALPVRPRCAPGRPLAREGRPRDRG